LCILLFVVHNTHLVKTISSVKGEHCEYLSKKVQIGILPAKFIEKKAPIIAKHFAQMQATIFN